MRTIVLFALRAPTGGGETYLPSNKSIYRKNKCKKSNFIQVGAKPHHCQKQPRLIVFPLQFWGNDVSRQKRDKRNKLEGDSALGPCVDDKMLRVLPQ